MPTELIPRVYRERSLVKDNKTIQADPYQLVFDSASYESLMIGSEIICESGGWVLVELLC